ncbi:hypothetical protein TNCV_858791 [Trichonephila clavipes]|nr:hypothetical protein TNCV_858791 [Trichonephila clavipes]
MSAPPKSCSLPLESCKIWRTLAIRDVEYHRCLDNPEQRVFDDMLRCALPIKTNLSPTAPRKKTNMRK